MLRTLATFSWSALKKNDYLYMFKIIHDCRIYNPEEKIKLFSRMKSQCSLGVCFLRIFYLQFLSIVYFVNKSSVGVSFLAAVF